MVIGQGLRVAAYGLVIGVLAALGLTRFLQSLLYGIGATDMGTFAGIATLVLLVTAAATALPAWRASRIDPIKSLKLD